MTVASSEIKRRKDSCTPEEIALKSFFLGPQSENAPWIRDLVNHVFDQWFHWRKSKYTSDGQAITPSDQLSNLFRFHVRDFKSEINELLERFHQEVPSYSPRYIGHMVTEISLPALIGHILTLLYNPNNISGEVSKVGLEIEKNAIGSLLSMMGFNPMDSFGHFTSGGTVANIEAALRSRSRMYKWLAVGAAARKLDIYSGDVYQAANMGWERYDNLLAMMDAMGVDIVQEMNSYHLLTGNPFDVSVCLGCVFNEPWRGPVMLVPGNKHYSWNKAAEILGLGADAFWEVRTNDRGRMDLDALRVRLQEAEAARRPVMLIVSVAGTTELGEVDEIDEVQEIIDTLNRDRDIDIWHHVDAAYGGFFCTLMYDPETDVLETGVKNALRAIGHANSATVDPHKLGFVPYASGAFLCHKRREYYHTSIRAPYIDFKSGSDTGVITLEGSRSAAGAVSTWLTSRVIGFDRQGYGKILERSILAARKLAHTLMDAHPYIRVNKAGDTNIVTFCVARPDERTSNTNKRSLQLYKRFSANGAGDFYISKTSISIESSEQLLMKYSGEWNAQWDSEELILLRMVLLNPFLNTKETNIDYLDEFVRFLLKHIESETD